LKVEKLKVQNQKVLFQLLTFNFSTFNLLYVAPSALRIWYLPVFYKYDTPLGLKSLKLMRMGHAAACLYKSKPQLLPEISIEAWATMFGVLISACRKICLRSPFSLTFKD
jgi:hypothetical protein